MPEVGYGQGRCYWHGGASTGARTLERKERQAEGRRRRVGARFSSANSIACGLVRWSRLGVTLACSFLVKGAKTDTSDVGRVL